ncbi:hypothetical protein EJ06DRAFT_525579 [Trichodelitschia bisporula]|uniref:Uncharacterized protein n=1 Tax=Trichodelitschia bisporula TaxID=703511 RepID=A0A6G1I9L8_9PEZI|nr:hypothetical protein EJ06DRAFT_525579 [Trichodelitschia bisporula]
MESLQFETREHQEFIPRSKLEELCIKASPDQNKSPRMTKSAGKARNARQQPQADPAFELRHLPKPPVTDLGVTPRIQGFLEVCLRLVH